MLCTWYFVPSGLLTSPFPSNLYKANSNDTAAAGRSTRQPQLDCCRCSRRTGAVYLRRYRLLLSWLFVYHQRFLRAQRSDKFELAIAAALSAGSNVGIARRLTAALDVYVGTVDRGGITFQQASS